MVAGTWQSFDDRQKGLLAIQLPTVHDSFVNKLKGRGCHIFTAAVTADV